jgi:lipopolysaccharide transport system permease protein
LPQIVAALMQIAFYITPIIYRPNALTRFSFIVDLNPLAHLIELVRAPLIGEWPSATTWGVAVGLAVAGWLFALGLTGRYLKRISYWV